MTNQKCLMKLHRLILIMNFNLLINEFVQENISNAGKGGDGSESGEGSTKSEFIKLKVSDQVFYLVSNLSFE